MDGRSRKPEDGWREPLWERQTDVAETAKAFEAFAIYRDLGPARSAEKTAADLGKTSRHIQEWCTAFGWVERAAAWDDEADRKQRAVAETERILARQRMLEGHAKLGQAMTTIAAEGLLGYSSAQPGGSARIRALAASELARLAETGAKMERLARGESTERIEMKDAMAWLEGFIDVALQYLPIETHEAFLVDIDSRLGVGGMSVR